MKKKGAPTFVLDLNLIQIVVIIKWISAMLNPWNIPYTVLPNFVTLRWHDVVFWQLFSESGTFTLVRRPKKDLEKVRQPPWHGEFLKDASLLRLIDDEISPAARAFRIPKTQTAQLLSDWLQFPDTSVTIEPSVGRKTYTEQLKFDRHDKLDIHDKPDKRVPKIFEVRYRE